MTASANERRPASRGRSSNSRKHPADPGGRERPQPLADLPRGTGQEVPEPAAGSLLRQAPPAGPRRHLPGDVRLIGPQQNRGVVCEPEGFPAAPGLAQVASHQRPQALPAVNRQVKADIAEIRMARRGPQEVRAMPADENRRRPANDVIDSRGRTFR